MKNYYWTLGIVLILFTQCKETEISSKPSEDKNEEYQLVWADEFNKDGLPDSTKWTQDVGNGCPDICGWGNNELEYYTKGLLKNARVDNGHLIIEAHKENIEGYKYSSSKLITKQQGDWLYGKFEIRAKLPTGVGTWPAIWMLPTDWEYGNWPASGEIDIMEHVGYAQDSVHGTIHTEAYNHGIGTHKGQQIFVENSANKFHTYGMEWTEDDIKWFIDDELYFEIKNERKTYAEWPFDKRFYLILNLAVGGNWGGSHGIDDSIFPQKMTIDYVRVYQKPSQIANVH